MKTLTSWMINVIVLLSFLSCSKKPIYQSRHEETIRSATSFDLHNYDSLKISRNNAFYIGVFNDDRKYTIRLKIIDETVQKKMLFFGRTNRAIACFTRVGNGQRSSCARRSPNSARCRETGAKTFLGA